MGGRVSRVGGGRYAGQIGLGCEAGIRVAGQDICALYDSRVHEAALAGLRKAVGGGLTHNLLTIIRPCAGFVRCLYVARARGPTLTELPEQNACDCSAAFGRVL